MKQRTWRAAKATRVLSALQRIGWKIKRQKGSHRTLERSGWPVFVFAYHDGIEIGPIALKKLAAKTGLKPDDL
jgi:predicted RNA binding protein YcfA (HicA-like mRNA interferase family)